MRSRTSYREEDERAGLPLALHMRRPVKWRAFKAVVIVVCSIGLLVPIAPAQDLPETAPIVRSTRPKPAPGVAPPAASAAASESSNSSVSSDAPPDPGKPRSHRRGMPPNVLRAQDDSATTSPDQTSLLQQPPRRAQVRIGADGMAIQANNSSLVQVLRDISSVTGMQVDGLGHDERVFGSYGPGAPRDVLSSLLEGAGYNVLMVGEIAAGAPRELILSRSAGESATPATTEVKPADDDAMPDQGDEADQSVEGAPTSGQPTAPGIQNPNAPSGSEVRTPQQLLEQLQRMHQDQPQTPQPTPE